VLRDFFAAFRNQGCQKVYFQTKFWYILWPLGIF
jgi:hypothetical protein